MTTTRITCEVSDWPLVVVRFPSRYSDTAFAVYLSELTALVARGPDALVIDTRHTHPPTPTQRQLLTRFVKSEYAKLTRLCGVVFISDSMIARYAMTAVGWLVATPCPVEYLANLDDARAWIAGQRSLARSRA